MSVLKRLERVLREVLWSNLTYRLVRKLVRVLNELLRRLVITVLGRLMTITELISEKISLEFML